MKNNYDLFGCCDNNYYFSFHHYSVCSAQMLRFLFTEIIENLHRPDYDGGSTNLAHLSDR